MLQVFVITDSDILRKSIERYFRCVGGETINSRGIPRVTTNIQEWVSCAYVQIADWIEFHAQQNGGDRPRETMVIIDLYDEEIESLSDLNAVSTNEGNWAAVVAVLILMFPEVHWVFNSPHQADPSPLFRKVHLLGASNTLSSLIALHEEKLISLFDPTGLRNNIRKRIKAKLGTDNNPIAPYIPIRSSIAAALDEEEAYAYFNGYTAYRLGYLTHAICSYRMMKDIFSMPAECLPELVFEDVYLSFSDRPHYAHLSDLVERQDHIPGIANARMRIFVTTGHSRQSDQKIQINNRDYLSDWLNGAEKGERYTKTLYKPLSGIFNLWAKSGIRRLLSGSKGLAEGYEWPPTDEGGEPVGTHSSPGRLLEVADRLIQRARRTLQNAQSVPEAVYGAVLALDAQEYLGHRTPTTSLEALALKHSAEVTAECKFYGVEYNKDVSTRLLEIKHEIRSIGKWFRRRSRRTSGLNAEVGIVSKLVMKFREYNQFDEEQQCLVRMRSLHRQLWLKKNRFWAWPFYSLRWYVEFLLGSMLVFALAIVFWIGFFSVLFALFCNCHAGQPETSLVLHGMGHAVTTFFGLQPAHSPIEIEQLGSGVFALTLFAILAGFTHLGIFVSHLYSLIARR